MQLTQIPLSFPKLAASPALTHALAIFAQERMKKQEEINKQLGVVVEATKDVRTLEKLEEKQLEDYKAAANKENEQFIEEFVSGQSIRAAQTQSV